MDNASKSDTAASATVADDVVDEGLSLNTVDDLSAAVAAAAEEVTDKPIRMYNKKGFKGLSGLEGIPTEILAVQAACIMRQIAINGGDVAHSLLGTEKKPGVLSHYGPVAVREAADEIRLNAYTIIAKDLGVKRAKGESANDFINRILGGVSAKNKG